MPSVGLYVLLALCTLWSSHCYVIGVLGISAHREAVHAASAVRDGHGILGRGTHHRLEEVARVNRFILPKRSLSHLRSACLAYELLLQEVGSLPYRVG